MSIDEIEKQLEYLSDKIDLINTNLQFNIATFLAILALAITITGMALVLLVKNIVNKKVEQELNKIDYRIKVFISKILMEELKEFKEKEVNCKIDKNSLINNTMANIKGFPLDATVANDLAKEINKIKNDIEILKNNEKTTL